MEAGPHSEQARHREAGTRSQACRRKGTESTVQTGGKEGTESTVQTGGEEGRLHRLGQGARRSAIGPGLPPRREAGLPPRRDGWQGEAGPRRTSHPFRGSPPEASEVGTGEGNRALRGARGPARFWNGEGQRSVRAGVWKLFVVHYHIRSRSGQACHREAGTRNQIRSAARNRQGTSAWT